MKEEIKNQETSAEYTDRIWTSRRTKKQPNIIFIRKELAT